MFQTTNQINGDFTRQNDDLTNAKMDFGKKLDD
jgi:hypothetical protein